MINKIVNEIQNDKYIMKHIENIVAIDFETIVIVNGNISWSIEDIIKDNRYYIYENNKYTIINGKIYNRRDLDYKQYELHNKFGHEEAYKRWYEFIHQPHTIIREIKIQKDDFYLKQLYKKYQKEEKEENYLTVKDLIKRLQKSDQNARVVIEDQEWGGYHPLYNSDSPMETITIRDCPDCSRGCCNKCPGREMFDEKLLSF